MPSLSAHMDQEEKALVSPEARKALVRFVDAASPEVTRKAWACFKEGGVREFWVDGPTLCGEIRAAGLHTSTLSYEEGVWVGECDCAAGAGCAHVNALANFWIDRIDRAPHTRPAPLLGKPRILHPLAREESAAATKPAVPPTTPVPAPVPLPQASRVAVQRAPAKPAVEAEAPGFVSAAILEIEEALGRRLVYKERATLKALAALHTDFRKHTWGGINVGLLRQHGFRLPSTEKLADWENVFNDWWESGKSPATPGELWQFMAYDLERASQQPFPFLAVITDTRAVRERLALLEIEKELRVWNNAIQKGVEGVQLPSPKVAGLRLKLSTKGWIVQVQTAPDAAFTDAKSNFYSSLRGELFLSEHTGLPAAQFTLLGLLRSEALFREEPTSLRRLVRAALALPELVSLMVGPQDELFVVETLPLSYLAGKGAPGRIVFSLVSAQEEDASSAVFLHAEPYPLYLWREKLWRGPSPLPAMSAPVALLGRAELLRKMDTQGVRFAKELELKVQRISLRPRLELRLEPSYFGGREQVSLRLCAGTPELKARLLWSHVGWHWVEGGIPPSATAEGVVLDYDRSKAELVAGLLSVLRISVFDETRWSCDLTNKFPEQFTEWRATLPPGVEFFADKALAGLIDAPWKASVGVRSVAPEASKRDWFDITIGLQVEDTKLSEQELALLLKARGRWVRLPGHGFRRLEVRNPAEAPGLGLLDQLGLSAQEVLAGSGSATHRVHALQLAGAGELIQDKGLVELVRRSVSAVDTSTPPLPPALTAELRPYQLEGFHFLSYLSRNGFGGILADDMGLGKTVQTLAWLLLLESEARAAGRAFHALVACPKSVTHGWMSETARFAPGLKVSLFSPGIFDKTGFPEGLLVCNYTQLRLNSEVFQAQAWAAVVLDEGQFIKNPGSQLAVTARELRSTHRIILTGTPVENRTSDLWSLFAFAQPGLLGSQAGFKRQYPQDDPAALGRLQRRTRHFMLRRTKQQVATDLPARIEDEIVVDLEEKQQLLYTAELKRARQQLLGVQDERGLDAVRFNILTSLLRLRQICCHPGLVSPEFRAEPSAKLEALVERLEELRAEGRKVLVFSQFVGMLEIIAERLQQEKIPHLLLTGQTEDRAALVERFQKEPDLSVFLLSIKAAGFGLNLTAADFVILYDPWWNPAVEAQAIDRAHRIGQTQVVTAYRLLAADTIEQKIRALQKEKAELANRIVQEESLAGVMDLESLRAILDAGAEG